MDSSKPSGESLAAQLQKARQTIRDLEERTRFILDSIHAGIVIIDREDHKIVDVNPEASRLIGLPKDDIIGSVCHKYICPAEVGSCPITDKGQKVDNSERILLAADGRIMPILKTVAPISLNGRWHLLETFLDITQLKHLQERLELLATTDSLTDVFNRRHFMELSEKEISRAQRSHTPLSIAIIDIDHFKEVNDRHGHSTGDVVLKELVEVCKGSLRPYDILGRLGGEEFAITMIDCALEEAFSASERLREKVAGHVIYADGQDISIKISIGVAGLSEETGNLDAIINRADQALYMAKNSGRNRVEK